MLKSCLFFLPPAALLGSALGCAVAEPTSVEADAFPSRADARGAEQTDANLGMHDAGPSACDLSLQRLHFDFEGGAQGFVHNRMPEVSTSGGGWTFDHWQQGKASGGISCASGQECFGTNLAGNYIQCQRAYLVSPVIDLSGCGSSQRVTVLFEHRYDFWSGSFGGTTWYDGGRVELSGDGTTWQSATVLYPGTIDISPQMTSSYACVEKNNFYVDGEQGYVGSSSGWESVEFLIPPDLATVRFQLRFVYGAGVSSQTASESASMAGTASGWYVDNIRFR